MRYFIVALLGSLLALLSACGDDPTVNQALSQKNASINGKIFIASKLPEADYVEFQSDSSITAKCPRGDGWASGTALTQGGKKVADLKCQTAGSTKGFRGCFTQEAFDGKAAYQQQDGVCDKSIKEMPDLSAN